MLERKCLHCRKTVFKQNTLHNLYKQHRKDDSLQIKNLELFAHFIQFLAPTVVIFWVQNKHANLARNIYVTDKYLNCFNYMLNIFLTGP